MVQLAVHDQTDKMSVSNGLNGINGTNGTRTNGLPGALKRSSDTSTDTDDGSRERKAKRVRIVDPAGSTAMDVHLAGVMLRKFVNNAIEELSTGRTQQYDELRKKFTTLSWDLMAPSTREMRQMIVALTHIISKLDHSCSRLVHDIINTNWAGRDDQFVQTYLSFLLHVISAHAGYVAAVTKMFVKHLTLQPHSVGHIPNLPPVPRKVIFNRAHTGLKATLEMVPTAYSTLFPALLSEFPHKDLERKYQTAFITNLLRLLHYAPVLRTKVIGLIIERTLQVDVEIQVNLDDLEEEEGETLNQDMNGTLESDFLEKAKARMAEELEEDDDDDDDDSTELSDDEDEEETSLKRIKQTVEKLDAMLEIVFAYFSTYFPEEEVAEPTIETMETFELLLHIFDITILPTYRSRYTQFLIFWAAQKSPMLTDMFLGTLINRAMDNTKPQVARQAACAYLASFVARATTLSRTSVRTLITLLCSWLEKFLQDRESECSGPDVGRFGGFYAVTQAVFYIFCFRWKDLRGRRDELDDDEEMDDTETWVPRLKVLERVIISRFNPLQVCSPVVVNQFARIANYLNFIYAFSIIEKNKRSNFSVAKSDSRAGGSGTEMAQLQSFFPFDPYKLPLSRCWINRIYVEWQGIEGLDDVDEDEDGENEEDSDDDDDIENADE